MHPLSAAFSMLFTSLAMFQLAEEAELASGLAENMEEKKCKHKTRRLGRDLLHFMVGTSKLLRVKL